MALLANTNRDIEKRPEPYKVEDFMYSYTPNDNISEVVRDNKKEEVVITDNWEYMEQKARMWVAASKVK